MGVLEQEVVSVKKDIEDIDMAIQKLEQEKTNRDHTIRTLNDEVAAEDKVNHLNQIKNKLEQTLDELEGSLDKEKRGRANVDKERRKVEGELKVAQETVAE